MDSFDRKSYRGITISSERSFGIVFSIIFTIIALLPLLEGGVLRIWALCIAMGFLILGFFAPQVLIVPNKLWAQLGIVLGSIVSPIVLSILFVLTVIPTGIIMRLLGKDLLCQKIDKRAKTYWVKRTEAIGSMKNQF